jgi:hypothetical protein
MSKTKAVDILSFDAVAESEIGFDLILKDTNGNETGVILVIIGKNADAVTNWQRREFNKLQREASMAQRRGKEPPQMTIEELRDYNMQNAVLRVRGWKNVTQEFSPELLKKVIERNPHFLDQIIEASDDVGNFTKAN